MCGVTHDTNLFRNVSNPNTFLLCGIFMGIPTFFLPRLMAQHGNL